MHSVLFIVCMMLFVVKIQTREGLFLYVESFPISFFHRISTQKLSFSYKIPEIRFATELVTNLKNFREGKLTSTTETQSDRQMTIQNVQRDIVSKIDELVIELSEIQNYAASTCFPNNIVEDSTCHVNFENTLDISSVEEYLNNVQTLDATIPKGIDKEIDANVTVYNVVYGTYKTILDLTHTLLYSVQLYVTGLQSLSTLTVTESQFALLKSSKCLRANPYKDLVKLTDCNFCSNTITCELISSSLSKVNKVGTIVPVPYFGNEIFLPNVYVNLTTKKLIKLECLDPEYKTNCQIFNTPDPCLDALQIGYLPNILDVCTFQPSKLTTPKLTASGLLVPNNNSQVYVKEDGQWVDLQIFEKYDPPVLVTCSRKLAVKGQSNFSHYYDPFSLQDKAVFSLFSKQELQEFRAYLGTFLDFLGFDETAIMLISQFSYGSGLLLLMVIILAICLRLRKQNKRLSTFQTRFPNYKPYSHELTNFLTEKTSRTKK